MGLGQAREDNIIIRNITVDQRLQSRPDEDDAYIDEMAEHLKAKGELPRITVFQDGATWWLAAGFQRLKAYQRAGIVAARANIYKGTFEDALEYSLSSNRIHTARRWDKHAREWAIRNALVQYPNWPTARIAKASGAHHDTVERIRTTMQGESPAERVDSLGRRSPTAKPKAADAIDEPPAAPAAPAITAPAPVAVPYEPAAEPPVAEEPYQHTGGTRPKEEYEDTDHNDVGDAYEPERKADLLDLEPKRDTAGKPFLAPSGQAIPKLLVDVFHNPNIRNYAGWARTVAENILKVAGGVPIIKSYNPHLNLTPMTLLTQDYKGVGDGETYKLQDIFKLVCDEFMRATPFGVCTKCDGNGCETCDGSGILTRTQFTAAGGVAVAAGT